MKSVNDKLLGFIIAVLAMFFILHVKGYCQQFVFKGVYNVQDVIINYCDDCFLQLPPDFLNSQIVLSVMTDESKAFVKSLQASSRAIGWDLTITKQGIFKAEPLQNVDNLVFISCMDNQPHNVPKYIYSASVQADRIQCAKRDSLERLARSRAERDSMERDSLSKIPPLQFANYQLRYYSYSKSFTDKIGVEWQTVLASGNLRGRLRVFDDWRVTASKTNDTSFTERSLVFSVDSSLNVDWGSEEQTLKQTFVNDGVTTQDYEWRKYGMIVQIKRDGKRVRMDYIFRDKENAISVLQGSVIGDEGDTLRLFGTYTTKRQVTNGVPFLSSIPLLGYLFQVTDDIIDNRAFELYLLPRKEHGKESATGKPDSKVHHGT